MLMGAKVVFCLVLVFLIWANWSIDPTKYVNLADGGSAEGIKAAMFALIAAAAFLATSLPFGQNHPYERWGLAFCNIVGGVAAFAAGWYWLDSEVEGSPGPFAYPLFVFGAIMFALAMAPALFPVRTERDQNSA